MSQARHAVEAVFREEHGLVLAGLIRYTGDIQLAEDALQDACVAALGSWRQSIPSNPAAWLTTAAKRKAIDRVRRAKNLELKYQAIGVLTDRTDEIDDTVNAVEDDRLRLIFTCCHPALAPDAQVALTLRTVGGLTTYEIARAFLVTEPTMAQRLVRAKKKIAAAKIPYQVPSEVDLPLRLPNVLSVIYLIFNEGYAASSGDQHIRTSLTSEAIRLGEIVDALLPHHPEIVGLRSLMELHDARSETRVHADGTPVLLPDQDRTLWDHERIEAAVNNLDTAVALNAPGPYQIQAAIAALHAEAETSHDTDWSQIAELYRSLQHHTDSGVITLNRGVAIAMSGDPEAGMAMIDSIVGLDAYPYLHAARAALLEENGEIEAAQVAYMAAMDHTEGDAERRFLKEQMTALDALPPTS